MAYSLNFEEPVTDGVIRIAREQIRAAIGAGPGSLGPINLGLPMVVDRAAAVVNDFSAGANVGLSVGVTDAAMPVLLKLTYIMQMWLGRLEFVAVFALFGFLYSLWRGK